LALAERGLHTLALSTDPTPSLAHIFAERGAQRVQRISRHRPSASWVLPK
jgi:anion-transporting  ArsA/GET3 family ATPase